MTNEEIKARARKWWKEQPYLEGATTEGEEMSVDIVAGVMTELVLQAYEEAAQIVDSWDSGNNGDHCDAAAAEIRALKDSLVAETVSS